MTYLEWLERFCSVTDEIRGQLRRKIAGLAHRPLISIIVPIYNADLEFLWRALESVRRQIYENWEICAADDASTDQRIRPLLERLAREDRRIKLFFREQNGHISACSNSALLLAEGEWCGLLDQDDELAEDALAEVVCEIASHPDATIIYSDEDFLDGKGVRSNPFFKPDWNPELFLAQNYLNHLGVYRTALLQEIGGFREGFEGSQDYDLALRCVARSEPNQIRHIPRLLYHWRMVEGSLAEEPDAKPYARHAARRALNSYLDERGIAAHAEACPQNPESHRIVYDTTGQFPKVTVITGLQDSDRYPETNEVGLEVIRSPVGAAAANAAAARAQGEILIFADRGFQTTEPDWLQEIVNQVLRPEVGAVGARLWSQEGTLEDGALILGLGGIARPPFHGLAREHPGYFNRAWLQQNLSAVSRACLAIRREVFLELGGFDARNLPHHYYDIDLCLRLREHKLQVIWTPYANLVLAALLPREGPNAASSEASYMHERWDPWLREDPSYNPNLSLDPPGFVLAIPPRIRSSAL